jgi:Rieske Fe-S protein
MERRDFLKFCAAASMASPAIAADARPKQYAKALLVDPKGAPLRARAIPVNENFIFHYPFAATPCFLLNLGRPVAAAATLKTAADETYEWRGGVGAGRSIVAYSAICAHRMTYPTKDISFISFRAEKTAGNKHAAVIHCCSEHSQYDPARGAMVVAGPAPQPLAAILLEWNSATDELHAVGTLGGDMFNAFFSQFEFKLALEHNGAARTAVAGSTVVQSLDNYCRQQVKC